MITQVTMKNTITEKLIKNNKITVSSIAKNAGVSVATAYNHFPDNKLDILGSIFKLGFEEVIIEYGSFVEMNHDQGLLPSFLILQNLILFICTVLYNI